MDNAPDDKEVDIEVGDVVRFSDGPLMLVDRIAPSGWVGCGVDGYIRWSHPSDLQVWHSEAWIEREFNVAYDLIQAERKKYELLCERFAEALCVTASELKEAINEVGDEPYHDRFFDTIADIKKRSWDGFEAEYSSFRQLRDAGIDSILLANSIMKSLMKVATDSP